MRGTIGRGLAHHFHLLKELAGLTGFRRSSAPERTAGRGTQVREVLLPRQLQLT